MPSPPEKCVFKCRVPCLYVRAPQSLAMAEWSVMPSEELQVYWLWTPKVSSWGPRKLSGHGGAEELRHLNKCRGQDTRLGGMSW